MSYQYTNPHPKGKRVGDCVKRAFTLATGQDYMEVQRELNALKKKTNSPKFNSNKNWREFIKLRGWEKMTFPAVKGQPRMNGWSFIEKFPKGTYVLRMARHLVTVKNGV